MSTTTHQEKDLPGIAREMDTPAAVIWTSIHVMRRCLEKIADGAEGNPNPTPDPTMDKLRQSVELAIVASERLVKLNRNLQQAIHLQDEPDLSPRDGFMPSERRRYLRAGAD